MRILPRFLLFLLSFAAATGARAGTGIIDLTTLANYAGQTVPGYIGKDNTPVTNPITDKGATLGRILFYDKRLSRDNTVACGSCHQQAHAFSDGATASAGVAGSTGRHTMRLVNARFGTEPKFFWDERAASLEAQTTQPIQNHVEMGFSGTSGDPAFSDLVTKLTAIPEYRVLFFLMYGDTTITETRVQMALAEFVRSIQSFDSKFDTGRKAAPNNGANFGNHSTSENNGKALFINASGQGGAGCAVCHRPPEFDIDPNSLDNGVITSLAGSTDLTVTRSPSLRDLLNPAGVPNGGFMHDGSKTTLASVVAHYNAIPATNTLAANFTSLDPRLRRPGNQVQNLGLTTQEQSDLAAFLATLTGATLYTDPKWSDPFDASGNLSLIIVPTTFVTVTDAGNGTATVACKGVSGLVFPLMSSPNLVDWTQVAAVTPNTSGICQKTVAISAGTYYRYVYQIPAAPSGSFVTATAASRGSTRAAVKARSVR